jgi:hypothetical protein
MSEAELSIAVKASGAHISARWSCSIRISDFLRCGVSALETFHTPHE